ncbi:NAD-dependent succinate-semialdehyde dehydrogenase [Enterovirga rhinocerotis]|uniref:Succinate-semialdehyde dehydrogenase/glutarate-semialdehyde dehydrogenase n=1 Tax=Enterovirga rhinocerotis TaxID=1339210 RepID=A0A4R7BVI9_9HYPH|nr:NAD-dependent succinate-semialdehyde dehydrogenase [Enterovirga rhinocerotis]TDR89850.1 succinate-semialdehyde dehydrogenase/glutarate-semialdehyde dehydrogenase [Enterovirga rhinocerotis]
MSPREKAVAAYPALRLFIAGRWVGAEGRRTTPVIDPTTERPLGALPVADEADLDGAIAAATEAFPAWRDTPPLARGRILRRAADLLRGRKSHWASLIALELGKPLAQAEAEIDTACEMFEWAADEGRRLYGRDIPARTPAMRLTAISDPVGPVGAIAGWNAPAITPARKISGALAAGCTIVIKPSEATPASALVIAQALEEAGLPPGVVNVVFGDPPTIGRTFATDPRLRLLTFTGGTQVGKELSALCAGTMKRMVMELGGHAPVLVFADSDIDAVAASGVTAKFRNSGQVCTSPTRFLVEAPAHDRFLEAFERAAGAIRVGDPFNSDTQMGPVQNARSVAALRGLAEDARDRGRVSAGDCPEGPGFWLPPTVVSGVPRDAKVWHEEPFGPLAVIDSFASFDEAVAEANRLSLGLAAYAWTGSLGTSERLARAIQAGSLAINHWSASFPETPFGGVKDSGFGLEGGPEGLMAFRQPRFVSVAFPTP